jgi:hypothetical protein
VFAGRQGGTNGTRMIIPGTRGEGERTWYQFDLSGDDIQVEHVVTLGLTSCSFACLFNDRYIVISHMSSKTIPVAWLAATVLGLTAETPLKLLVSHVVATCSAYRGDASTRSTSAR